MREDAGGAKGNNAILDPPARLLQLTCCGSALLAACPPRKSSGAAVLWWAQSACMERVRGLCSGVAVTPLSALARVRPLLPAPLLPEAPATCFL